MKKLIYFIFAFQAFTFSFAQKKADLRLIDKQFNITRVSLKEKFNLPARDLPSLVIQAYCEGSIVGYYPLKPKEVCGYHEFVAHFGVGKYQPARNDDAFEEINCPKAFCYTKNEATIEPFRLYFDIMEDKAFSKETSSQKHNIKYIRLLFVYEKHGLEIILDGPLFLYDDLIKLNNDDYSLPNPKNDAAKTSFKKYFESRMFHGFPLINNGDKPKQTNK
jgi:hypothetical protein